MDREGTTHFDARIEAISLRGTTSRSLLSHSSTPSSSSRRGTSASHFLTSSLPLREPLPAPVRWTTDDEPAREADHEPVDEASELRRALALPADEPRRRIGLGSDEDALDEPGGSASASDEVDDWRDGWGRALPSEAGVVNGESVGDETMRSSTIGGVASPRGRLKSFTGERERGLAPPKSKPKSGCPPPPVALAFAACCCRPVEDVDEDEPAEPLLP